MKKRLSPIHHSEKEIGAPAGIGKGIESVGKVNPECLYRGRKLCKGLGLRAGFPPALLAIVHPVTQINPIVLRRVEEASRQAAIRVQIAQGPAAEPPDRERHSILFNEGAGIFSENPLYDVLMR
jgi:hypothetical protein